MLVSRAGLHFRVRIADTFQTATQHYVLRFRSRFVLLVSGFLQECEALKC
jgi:hypothetical protein